MKKNVHRYVKCILLSGMILLMHAGSRANPFHHEKLDSGAPKIKLKQALLDLQARYHVSILFEDKAIENFYISADVMDEKAGIEENLNSVLKPFNLHFQKEKQNAYIIITPQPHPKQAPTEGKISETLNTNVPVNSPENTIRGLVRDDKGLPLAGVSVSLEGTSYGTVTDNNGNFVLPIPSSITSGKILFSFMADQSSVILNANSDLRVPRFLSLISGRTVSLKGEAIFNVKHEAGNRSFEVIMPNQWKIQVLGTEFNVYARNAESKVFLNRGSIRLLTRSADKEPLMLKPGDLVTEDKNKVIQRSSNRSLVEFGGWKDHVFNFNATPLSRVAQMLEDQFGKKISIADTALANRNISGSCRWETEDDILINLSMMMKFNVIQVNDSIVLK